jgi:tripartite-type tricarboxylate transporter receptor subunit TctC
VPTGPAPTTMTFRRCIFRCDYTGREEEAMRVWVLVLAALCAPVSHAQQWPQKPVKVVVPFPPGGVTDAIARITADWLAPRLGQPVIAENRPGASGAIAAEFVARADADGYTLFSAATPQLSIVPHVQKISYDPLKDFAPISIVGTNPFALGCNANLPPKNLTELVAYAKERPGQLSYASPGSGSVGHLTMALFLARAGLKMEAVLYKGGGPAIADVVAGHVPCYFGNLNEIIPHAGGGRLKVFAVSSLQRAAQLPQVPTVAEQGYPGFRTVTWNGYVAPASTPRPVIERIAREIAAGCKDAAFVERLNKIGVDAACSTPEEFAKAIRDDLEVWKEAVQAAGIKK